jgi:hypothetical protein
VTKRIVLYGAMYGLIGVTVGVLLALYTNDETGATKSILLNRAGLPKTNDNGAAKAATKPAEAAKEETK